MNKILEHIHAAVEIEKPVGTKGDPNFGSKWRVQVIKYGPGKDGRINWTKGPLVAALPLFDKSRVFMNEKSQHVDPARAEKFGKPVKDLVGWLSNPSDTGDSIHADFDVLSSATKLRSDLIDSFERDNPGFLGLSVDVSAYQKEVMVAGKKMFEPVKIVAVSTDVVYSPTNDGKFLKMVAAGADDPDSDQKEEHMWQKLLAALMTLRPDLKGQLDPLVAKGDAITEAEVQIVLAAAIEKPADMAGLISQLTAATKGDDGAATLKKAEEMLGEARRIQAAAMVDAELKASGLPEITQAKLKKLYAGQSPEQTIVQAAIKEEKEYLDKLQASGHPTDVGFTKIEVQGERERMQASMDKLLGVVVDAKYGDVAALTSLRAAYVRYTGDTQITGMADPKSMQAAYGSGSFTFVLGNSLYRRLIQDYKAVEYFEDILVSYYRNAQDFRTLESINVGYFSDIPDVNPENADYVELTMPTDEEMSYALNQKGGILTITRKVILNDDLRSVQTLVGRVGRAAKRTYARRVWNKIISNSTYKGDNVALFHANHANLGSVAFTNDATGITTLTNRLIAMYAQTEKSSLEGLGLQPKYVWGPRALREVMLGLNSPWPGVAGGNPHAGRWGASGENIITNPLFTDATDWGLVADKNDVELLEVAFLNGVREPQMFVADNPLVGQMFVADKIQYKIRHEYEVEIADFRGFDKSVVAG